jgi:hypothetical protein
MASPPERSKDDRLSELTAALRGRYGASGAADNLLRRLKSEFRPSARNADTSGSSGGAYS